MEGVWRMVAIRKRGATLGSFIMLAFGLSFTFPCLSWSCSLVGRRILTPTSAALARRYPTGKTTGKNANPLALALTLTLISTFPVSYLSIFPFFFSYFFAYSFVLDMAMCVCLLLSEFGYIPSSLYLYGPGKDVVFSSPP